MSVFARAIGWVQDKAFESHYGVKPENASTIDPETEVILRKLMPERAFRDTENPILKVIRVHDD